MKLEDLGEYEQRLIRHQLTLPVGNRWAFAVYRPEGVAPCVQVFSNPVDRDSFVKTLAPLAEKVE